MSEEEEKTDLEKVDLSKFDPKEMIQIQLGVDIPDEKMKEWNLDDDEVKALLQQGTFMIYQFFIGYVAKKNPGLFTEFEKKKDKNTPSYWM